MCSGDSKGAALAHRSIGEVLQDLMQFDESIRHKKQYLAIAIQLQDSAEEQRALYVVAQTYQALAESSVAGAAAKEKNSSKALEHFERSLAAVMGIPASDLERGEREIMRTRCLRNLASISWQLGRKERFAHFFSKAKDALSGEAVRKHYEDHYGLYDEAANLLLTGDEDDLKQADTYSRHSLEMALKVHGKRERLCHYLALFTRSKVQILQEEFEEASQGLFLAYRKGVSSGLSPLLKADAENNLKMVAVVVKARERIAREDRGVFKHLEEIADSLCKYCGGRERRRVLGLAVKYYHKAAQKAEEEGEVECLPALNSSIAQTYEETEDFHNAETFFLKQLEYESGLPEPACQTYSHIASVQESLGRGFTAVLSTMLQWLDLATDHRLEDQKRIALQELVKLHDRLGEGGGQEYRTMLGSLGEGGTEEELASSQGSSTSSKTSDNFPEIDLEALSYEEALSAASSSRPRRVLSKFVAKTNQLGDTKLHKAAQQAGKTGQLLDLLHQGHPVDPTDNAGWTPLGDAVGNSNLEAVKILMSFKANINHANDKGETPFIAACMYGWLVGAELLLDRGAKVHLKDKKGNTGLAYLKNLRDDEDNNHTMLVEELVAKVEATYNKMGLELGDVTAELEEDSPCLEGSFSLPPRSPSPPRRMRTLPRSPSSSPEGRPRRIASSPINSRSPSPEQGTRQYKEVIKNLRGTKRPALQPLDSGQKRSAPGRSEGVCSDISNWLDDDVGEARKKKKSSGEFSACSQSLRENRSPGRTLVCSSASIDLTSPPPIKSAVQKALSVAGVSLSKSRLARKSNSFQPKINHIYDKASSRTPSPSPISTSPPPPSLALPPSTVLRKVRVRIEQDVLLVPLTTPDLTLGWLAGEVAVRYRRAQEGRAEPVLSLSTSDGALLDAGDLVSDVMDCQDPLLVARLTGWVSRSPQQIYHVYCAENKLTYFTNIHQKLVAIETCHVFLFSGSPLRQQAEAVLASLRGAATLRELTLSGCKLSDSCRSSLTACLSSLPSLASLDLSSNLLSPLTLRSLSSLAPLPSLHSLDFSRNMLGDCSIPDFAKSFPNMTKLSLKSCYLGSHLSLPLPPSLQSLDLSLNPLGSAGLLSLLSGSSSSLLSLAISGCVDPQSGHLPPLSTLSQFAPLLTKLVISHLALTDDQLVSLLPALARCRHLGTLDLSHSRLTAQGIVPLLVTLSEEQVPLTRLLLPTFEARGFWECGEEELYSCLVALLNHEEGLKLEEVVLPPGGGERVTRLWGEVRGSKALVTEDSMNNIVLSIS